FFFSSRRRHTRFKCDWSSDVCSSDLRAARYSLSVIDAAELGFDRNNLLLVTISSTGAAATPAANIALLDRMLDAVRGVPGVTSRSEERRVGKGCESGGSA